MKKIYLVTALACCALQPTLAQKQEECKPVNLHCDHLINPLGIDNANPRLSWMLDDARQGARQTAYQIIVSTDSLKANNENGEIWNSGKKESDQILVTYPEKNLQPFTKYYWKVNVWFSRMQAIPALCIAFIKCLNSCAGSFVALYERFGAI